MEQKLDWLSPAQAAELWNLSERHVQALCADGKIEGVVRLGRSWLIPRNAVRPVDGRTLAGRQLKKDKGVNDEHSE